MNGMVTVYGYYTEITDELPVVQRTNFILVRHVFHSYKYYHSIRGVTWLSIDHILFRSTRSSQEYDWLRAKDSQLRTVYATALNNTR